MNIKQLLAACSFSIALALVGVAHANVIYTVSLNTSAISGAAGYALAFSFTDGSGVGDTNNTVTLDNFNFGVGGSAAGSPVPSGGGSGSIGTSVVLSDSDFLNTLVEGFTLGASLSFNINLTTNVDAGGTPDFFGFSLLSGGTSLLTQDDTLGDNFLYFNIDSANPAPAPWATEVGSPVTLSAPAVALASPNGQVPEPGSLLLLMTGLAGLFGVRQQRVKQ
jgi:hypothetical protein